MSHISDVEEESDAEDGDADAVSALDRAHLPSGVLHKAVRKHGGRLRVVCGESPAQNALAWRCPVHGCRSGLTVIARASLTVGGFRCLHQHRNAMRPKLTNSQWQKLKGAPQAPVLCLSTIAEGSMH